MGGIIKGNNIFSKNEKIISKLSFLLVLTPLFLIFFSSLIYSAIIPEINMYETGKLNSTFFTGNFTIKPTGYNLSGFTIDISNYSYVNHYILDSTSVSQNYKINNSNDYINYISENITYNFSFNQIKQIINLTQNWNETVNITVNKILPNNCLFDNVSLYNGTNFVPISYSYNNMNNHLSFNYLQNKTKIFQIICNASYEQKVNFTKNNYTFRTNKVFTKPIVFANTNSYISAKKEVQEEYFTWENGSRWQIWFELFNDDDLIINISQIHFWASNKTDDYQNWSPDKNYLYNTYISCATPTLSKGQYCEFNDTFYSKTTPVVWADVDYTILFNITGKGIYNYSGNDSSTQISGLFVGLNSPIKNEYVDTQTQVNLSFSVTNYSNCSLYTNTTGSWNLNQTLNGVIDTNEFSIDSLNTGKYSWSVFCVDYYDSSNNISSDNETFIANAIPRFSGPIPDLIWSEDTINHDLNLTDYFSDPEGDEINWTYLPSPLNQVSVSIDNLTGNVTLIPELNYFGIRYIQFIAHDEFGRNSTSNIVTLNITQIWDPPTIDYWEIYNETFKYNSSQPAQNITGSENTTIRFSANVSDPDLTLSNFFWFLYNGASWLLKKSEENVASSIWDFVLDFFSAGDYKVKLFINSSYDNYNATKIWNVTINNTNRPPNTTTLISPTDSSTVEQFGVLLNWTDLIDPDDVSFGGTSYDFYNITYYIFHSTDVNPVLLNTTTNSSYFIEDQIFEQTYYWYIIASDGNKNASPSEKWSYFYKKPIITAEKNRVFYEDATPINITVDAKKSGLTLETDFSCMDSEYTLGDETITDHGNGFYNIYYWIDISNTYDDRRCIIEINSSDGRQYYMNLSLKNGYWEAFYVGRANDCAGGLPTSNYFEEGGMCPTIPYKVDTSFAFGKFAGTSAEKLCTNAIADEYDPSGASATDTDGADCADYDCASIVYGEPIGAKENRTAWSCAYGTQGWRDDPPWINSGFTCYDSINLCSGGSGASPTGTTNWIYTKKVKPGGYFAIRFRQENLASEGNLAGGLYLNVNSLDEALDVTGDKFFIINRSDYFGGAASGLIPQQGLVTTSSMIRAQTDDGSGTMTDYTGDDLDIIMRLYIPPTTTASGLQQVKVTRYFPTAASKDYGIEFEIENDGMLDESDISCSDNEDNDLNYLYDCKDLACENETGNPSDVNDLCRHSDESKYAHITNDCMDGFDNDRDLPATQNGPYDCQWTNYDSDCDNIYILDSTWDTYNIAGLYGATDEGVCQLGTETNCTDGFDNDRDRAYDCYTKEIRTGFDYDSDIDYNTNPTNPLCSVSSGNPYSFNTNDHPDAEYNCAAYCQANNYATEAAVGLKGCLDGKDNDLDFFNIGGCAVNAGGGVDCRMREYDPDCDGEPMQQSDGNTGNCELIHELTCNDNVDNNRNGMTDCETVNVGASGIPEYRFLSGMTGNYDCQNSCNVSSNFENTGTKCRDNIDNDLDYWTITGWSSNQYTATNNQYGGGLDCRYNYDGNHYPDADCEGVTITDDNSNNGACQLGNELTCNDGADNDVDRNHNKGGDRRLNIGGFDCDDYDCGGNAACPTTESSIANACLDGIDNDLDRYNRGHTNYQLDTARGINSTGGLDCIYNFDGIRPSNLPYLAVSYDNYLSDPDCDGAIIGGSGEKCELYEENNCTDNFDNDQDQYISTTQIKRSGWAGNVDLTRGSVTYNTAADCDDYSCQGKTGCPITEVSGLCLIGDCAYEKNWCLDGIDNDLDDYDSKGYTIDNTVGNGIDCAWNNWDSDCNGALFNDTNGNNLVGTCEIRTEVSCNDGVDNDQDRGIYKLAASVSGSETAGYGTGIDCDDYDCSGNAACPIKENATTCGDGIDNDLDMFYWDGSKFIRNESTGIDCADPDCQGLPGPGGMLCAKQEQGDLICGDYDTNFFAQDNDGNGPANCYDGGCYQKGQCRICPSQENFSIDSCADGLDNEITYQWIGISELLYKPENRNGSISLDGADCADVDCSGFYDGDKICGATETSCNDGLDNDRDGDIDCDDSDCSGNINCPSIPTNTITTCTAGFNCNNDNRIRSRNYDLPRYSTQNGFGSTSTRLIYTNHVYRGQNTSYRFTNSNSALVGGSPATMLVGSSSGPLPSNWNVLESLSYDENGSASGYNENLFTPVKVSSGVQLAYTPYPTEPLDINLLFTINHSDDIVSNSPYTFKIAHDIGGEMNTGTDVTIYVYEDEKPNVTWVYPYEDDIVRRIRASDKIQVRVNAFDNDVGNVFNSGIDYCQFYNGVTWVDEDSISSTSKGNCRHLLTISDGESISIGARARDGVDNLGDAQYRNISVRTIPRQVSDFQCLDGDNCSWDYPARKWYNKTELLPIRIRFTSEVSDFSSNAQGCQVFFATDTQTFDMGNISLVPDTGTTARCDGTINLSDSPIFAEPFSNYAVYVKIKDNAGEIAYSGIEPYRDTFDMNDVWICNWIKTPSGWSCLAPCDGNTPPIITNITNVTLPEDSIPPINWTDLWNFTTDNEQWDGELGYSIINQTNSSLINCSVVYDRYVNCTPPAKDAFGLSTIVIRVTDGFESDIANYTINITPVNDAPRLSNNISNMIILEDGYNDSINLNNYFIEIENEDMNWNVNHSLSDTRNLTIEINNVTGILNITPDTNFNGFRYLTLNVFDIHNARNISNNFTINVTFVNDAPTFNDTINNITFAEDTYNDTINLSKHYYDIDGDDLNWSFNPVLSNVENLTILINNNTGLVNITSDLNFFGLRWMTFVAHDPSFATASSNNVTINIAPVNDAPIFNDTISNITFAEDTIYLSLNLSKYSYDVDDINLNWTINQSLSSIDYLTININNNTGIVTIIPDGNFTGIQNVTFNVHDSYEFATSNLVTINVTSVNDAPTFNDTISNITFAEDTYNDTINLSKHYYDIDGDDLNWSFNPVLSNIENLTIDINNNTGLVNITSDLNFFGLRWITFVALDPDDEIALSNNVTINITPVNDAPFFNDSISNITFAEDTIYSNLNLSRYSYDVDDINLNWTVNHSLSIIENLTININNNTGIVTIIPDGNFTGIRFVTFNVYDSYEFATSNLVTINVTPVNDAPTFNDTISNITFAEDTYNDTINLSKHYYDIDGDDLNWSFNPVLSNVENLTILINNNTGLVNITSDLNFFGLRWITFVAYDPSFATASSNNVTINITPVNDAPIFNDSISNITFAEDTIYSSLNLSRYSYDVDDMDLNWTINQSLSSISNLTININNNTGIVTIIPDGNFTGIQNITFNVHDSYEFATSNLVTINVTPVNDAPTFNDTINNITFAEDTYNDTINLSKHYYDIDGDDLNWSFNPVLSNVENLTILINNNTGLVNITSDLNFFGLRWITFVAYDPSFATASSNNISINVTPVNDAPIFNDSISNITFAEDTIYSSLNLSRYSFDVDDIDLNWTINQSLSSIDYLTISVNNNTGIVTIIPDGNFTGIQNITFNVHDSYEFATSNLITINVTPVNDAPTFNDTINNITFAEDTYNDTINLSKHYYDIDGDDLNWSFNPVLSNVENLTIDINNNTGLVNITSDLNFFGLRWITFVAHDPSSATASSNNISINVTPVNDAPIFNDSISNITFAEDTIYSSLNLSRYSYDVDDMDLNWTINQSLSSISNLTILINNNTGIVTIIPDGNFTGIQNITFNVHDSYEFATSNLVTINVTPVNDAPTFNDTINNITFAEDTYNDTINLSKHYYDIDGDDLNWSFNPVLSNVENLTIDINNNTGLVNITSDLNFFGLRWMTFVAHDPSSATASSNNVTINITPVNDAPIFNDSISNITFAEDTINSSLNLSRYSYDVDDINLNWTVNHSLSIIENLTININNDTGIVTIIPDGNFTGIRFVTFNVYDSALLFGTSNLVTINVTPVNDAPTFNDTIPNISFAEDTYNDTINLSKHYYDIDGDDLNWSFNPVLSNVENLTIDINNNTGLVNITSDLNFFGLRWITFVAHDPSSETASSNNVTITVMPVNDAPVINYIKNVTFLEDTYNDTLNLSDYVFDVDNTVQEINWTYENITGNKLYVLISNVTKIVNFTSELDWYGSELIEFTAHDIEGLTASYIINVTVMPVNDPPVINPIMPNITLDEDFGRYFVNLTLYETDIDNDNINLNWTISGLNLSLVNYELNKTTDNLTFISLADINGVDNFTFILTDSDGLTDEQNITITINPVNDAPYPFNLISPTDENNVSDNRTYFNWEDVFDIDTSDTITYYLLIDDSFNFDTIDRKITTSDSNYTLTLSQSLSDGVWYWRIKACDNSFAFNNCTYSNQNYSVRIDTTGPKIIIDSPNYNETVAWNITFYNTITDDIEINIVNYTIRNSSSLIFKTGNLFELNSFDFYWDTNQTIPDGTYNLTIFANDSLGNSDTNWSIFTIDNTKPGVQIVHPNKVYLNKNFSVTIDNHNEHLTNTSFNITNSTGHLIYENKTNFWPTIKDWQYLDFIDISLWNDDNYTISAYARDEVDNFRNKSSWFVVDQTMPNLVFINRTSDPLYNNKNVTINVSFIDQFDVVEVNISHNATGFWNNISASNIGLNLYQIIISHSLLENGEKIGYRAVAKDRSGNVNNEMPIYNFTISNRPTQITDINFSKEYFKIYDELNCSANIRDADNDSIDILFRIWDSQRNYFNANYNFTGSQIRCNSTDWTKQTNCYVNISSITGYKGNWSCAVRVVDGFDTTLSYSINTSEMINTIPKVSSPSINYTAPTLLDKIECINGTFNDDNIEDTQQSVEWNWYKNNLPLAHTNKILNLSDYWPGTFVRGDNITCSQRVYDGTNYSLWNLSTNNATITNYIPKITYINTTPYNNATSNENLFCNYTIFDADLDIDLSLIDWYKNNISTGINNITLKSTNTSDSDLWHCQVTPYDGLDYGVPVNSTTVFVRGSRPDIVSFIDNSNETNPINVGDVVNISVDWFDLDQAGGGENVSLYVCNTTQVNPSGCLERQYCAHPLTDNDPINCNFTAQESDNTTMLYYVSVCDDSGYCSLVNETTKGIFHVNHVPKYNFVFVESSVNRTNSYTNDTLICNYSYFDIDLDTVLVNITWYEYNTTHWINTGITTQNFQSSNTLKHNSYYCEVNLTDEHSFKNSRDSNNNTVLNRIPDLNITGNIKHQNITFAEDNYNDTINLTELFYDIDQDKLYWKINKTESSIENLTITYSNITGNVLIIPYSNFYGIRTLVFSSSDLDNNQGGWKNSNTIIINVTPVNDVPFFDSIIPNITFAEDTYNDSLNLSDYSFDIENEDINWSINTTLSKLENLTINIDNVTGQVNFTADLNFFGVRWIYFNVYDYSGEFNTSNNITINVTPVNDVPYFNDTLNNISFSEDTIYSSLNLSKYSYDVDNVDLNWTINQSLSIIENLTILINNDTGIVTIIPDNNFTDIRYITFNVWDSFGATSLSNLITINVTPVNDRPIFISLLPNITFAEDTYNDSMNLLVSSFDVDGDDMNWSIAYSQSNIENLTININNLTGQVNFTADIDFFGLRYVIFNVSDPSNTFDLSNNITINVTPVNDAPYFNDTINNITFPEDTIFNSLNLSKYSYDVDDLDLNWTVNQALSSIENLTILINNDTGIVTIIPDNNFTDTRHIVFNVLDSFNATATSNLITINVTPVNDRPIFTSFLPNITFAEDTFNDSLNLLDYSFDVDGDDMNWSIDYAQSNIENLTVNINNLAGQVNFTADVNFFGLRYAVFNVSDPSNTFDLSNNITINVTPVNDAPYFNDTINNIAFPEDTIFSNLNLSRYSEDVDDTDLNWTINHPLSSIENLTILINNDTGIVTIIPDNNFTDVRYIIFNVLDSFNATATSNLITINVTPVNDRPIFTSFLPNITFAEDTYNDSLNLLASSFDVDGDDMNWTIDYAQSNIENLTVNINNLTGQVNFTADVDFFGLRYVVFNVSDPSSTFDLSNNITINVTSVNDAPYFNDTIPEIVFPEDTIFNDLNLSKYSEDVDDIDLNWTINYPLSIIDNLTISINNDTGIVTIIPDNNFTDIRYITFTVWDSFNATATSNLITINVTPVNDRPIFTSLLPNITFAEDTYNDSLNLLASSFDVDGDDINWTIDYAQSNIENLTININNLTGQLNFTADVDFFGLRYVVFNVSDPSSTFDLSNNITINVTPVNDAPRQHTPIPNIIFPEDTIFNNLNLSDYFYDVEGSYINYTVNTSLSFITNLSVFVQNITGEIAIVPDGNFTNNNRYIFFNAIDNESATTLSQRINIDVTPVNDAPAPISTMPNLTILENDYNTSIILDDYVWDVDNEDWELTWSYISTKGNLTAHTIRQGLTQIANISGLPEWNGIESLILKVCDAEYCRNTTITVTVLGIDYPLINSYNITNISTPWHKFVSLPSIYDHIVYETLSENSSFEFIMNITDDDYNDSMNLTWFIYDLYDGHYNGYYKSGNDFDKNMNISFDWHDAGDYRIVLTAKDLLNHTTSITWNIFVENKNRAPNKPQILFPPNNHFYTYNNTDWNWTLVTDPDELSATDYDIYDIRYRLLIANSSELIETMLNIDDDKNNLSINMSNNATVFLDRTFDDSTDFYKLLDYERLPSGTFYAILVANDSQDFNYSNLITFEVDLPPEVKINRIFRNPAKINFHNVTINWTAYDDLGIQEKYINITDPGGLLIGTFNDDIKLHPDNMTKNGTYQIIAFVKDLKNSTAMELKNFTVMYDIYPPEIKLISPKLSQIVPGINSTVGGSGTVIFEYNVTDLSPIENCSLYLKHKFATILIPWSSQAISTEIYDGLYGYKGLDIEGTGELNRFVIPNLLRGQYTWNIFCVDNENNSGFSRYNRTFELDIPASKLEEEIDIGTGEVSQNIPKYGLKLDVAQLELDPYDVITTNAILSTTQDPVNSIEIRTNVSWLIFDETYINQLSGSKNLLLFINTNNLLSGNHSVEFLITAQQVSYKKIVTFVVKGSKKPAVEIPGISRLLITKSVNYLDETNAIVNITYNNMGYSRIDLVTLVDDLENSKLVSYDTKLSELNSNNELITKLYSIGIGEKNSFTYRLKDSNPKDIITPKILEDDLSVTFENEINIPMISSINMINKFATEKIIFSLFLLLVALSVIAKISFVYIKKK